MKQKDFFSEIEQARNNINRIKNEISKIGAH